MSVFGFALKYPISIPSLPESEQLINHFFNPFLTTTGWVAVAQIPVNSSKAAWPDLPCWVVPPPPQKRNPFIVNGFSFLPPTTNISRFGWKGPEVPIIISIQLSANKPFLIINLAITEKTVMFHGRGSEDKLLHECCNAMIGGGQFRPRLRREEVRALRWFKPQTSPGRTGAGSCLRCGEHSHCGENTAPAVHTTGPRWAPCFHEPHNKRKHRRVIFFFFTITKKHYQREDFYSTFWFQRVHHSFNNSLLILVFL